MFHIFCCLRASTVFSQTMFFCGTTFFSEIFQLCGCFSDSRIENTALSDSNLKKSRCTRCSPPHLVCMYYLFSYKTMTFWSTLPPEGREFLGYFSPEGRTFFCSFSPNEKKHWIQKTPKSHPKSIFELRATLDAFLCISARNAVWKNEKKPENLRFFSLKVFFFGADFPTATGRILQDRK